MTKDPAARPSAAALLVSARGATGADTTADGAFGMVRPVMPREGVIEAMAQRQFRVCLQQP